MSGHDHAPERPNTPVEPRRPFLGTPLGLLLCVVLALAGLLLWIDHRVHIIEALPFLLPLIVCLGMHVFMHGGHHGGHGRGGDYDER